MAAKRTHILLTLFQCGESRWEQEGRLHGSADLPLSNAGRSAVSAAASRLGGTACATIHHPPDEAATETARLMADSIGAKTKVAADLADADLGLLEGMLVRRFAEQHPKRYKQWQEDPLSLVPPEGEPIAKARERVFQAVARMLRKSRAPEVGMVVRPISLGLLRCWLARRPWQSLWAELSDRPRVERYEMPIPLIDELRHASNGREPSDRT